MERRSVATRRRHDYADSAFRHADRPDSGPRHPVRNDRRLPADARPGPCPGAKSARRACRGDGVRHFRTRRRPAPRSLHCRKTDSTSISAVLSAGNTITVNYTDTATNTPHTITLDAGRRSVGPCRSSNTATNAPNDTVFGIDFSGGMGSVIAQINAALTGTGMTASNPAGTTLEVLDDGAGQHGRREFVVRHVNGDRHSQGAPPSFRCLLTVQRSLYGGYYVHAARESIGLARRIAVNPAVAADPSTLSPFSLALPPATTRDRISYMQQLTGRIADVFVEHRYWHRRSAVHRVAHHLSPPGSSASRARPRHLPTT